MFFPSAKTMPENPYKSPEAERQQSHAGAWQQPVSDFKLFLILLAILLTILRVLPFIRNALE